MILFYSAATYNKYSKTVNAFDWGDFYKNWAGEIYFEWFRKELLKIADVILIDSRTGVTEMGGVCTYQLADIVVLLCTGTEQNLNGTSGMIQDLTSNYLTKIRVAAGRDEIKYIVIPSKIDQYASNQKPVNEFRKKFINQENFFKYIPDDIKQKLNFHYKMEIPYVGAYSYTEKIAIRLINTEDESSVLVQAYIHLLFYISNISDESIVKKRLRSYNLNETDDMESFFYSEKGCRKSLSNAANLEKERHNEADTTTIRYIQYAEKSISFREWTRNHLKKILSWGYIIVNVIFFTLFFKSSNNPNNFIVNFVFSIHVGQTVAIIVMTTFACRSRQTSDKLTPQVTDAIKQYMFCWKGIWFTFLGLYLSIIILDTALFPEFFKYLKILPDFFNNLSALFFVSCYWIFTIITISEKTNKISSRYFLNWVFGLVALFSLYFVSLLAETYKASKVVDLLTGASGFMSGLAMLLFFYQFYSFFSKDSKLVLYFFFLYALIQPSYGVFRSVPGAPLIFGTLALFFKCVLFLYIEWILDTQRLHRLFSKERKSLLESSLN